MPTFNYEALDAGGKPAKGKLDADNSESAIASIRGQGLFPTAVREVKTRRKPRSSADIIGGNDPNPDFSYRPTRQKPTMRDATVGDVATEIANVVKELPPKVKYGSAIATGVLIGFVIGFALAAFLF